MIYLSLRSFVRGPGFTALAVSSLATGVGLMTTLASIADAILYRPLPVARPAEIVRIFTASPGQPLGFVSYPDFEDFRAARTLAGVVAQSQVLVAVGGQGAAPAQVRIGLAVTPDYFDVLGVAAWYGRTFGPGDAREPVVVLAHSFWESRFGADRTLVGRTIRLGGTA